MPIRVHPHSSWINKVVVTVSHETCCDPDLWAKVSDDLAGFENTPAIIVKDGYENPTTDQSSQPANILILRFNKIGQVDGWIRSLQHIREVLEAKCR